MISASQMQRINQLSHYPIFCRKYGIRTPPT
nr:MAG TPA: putative cellulose synthase A catalytic synthase, plant conserved region [Bacteriophage sp.]